MPDEMPQDRVAARFMRHKGYPGAKPFTIEKLVNQSCWYYAYELPEGILELEVSWNEEDFRWETLVTTFAS